MHRPEEQLAEHRHSRVIVKRDDRVSWQEQDNHLPSQCKYIREVKRQLFVKNQNSAWSLNTAVTAAYRKIRAFVDGRVRDCRDALSGVSSPEVPESWA